MLVLQRGRLASRLANRAARTPHFGTRWGDSANWISITPIFRWRSTYYRRAVRLECLFSLLQTRSGQHSGDGRTICGSGQGFSRRAIRLSRSRRKSPGNMAIFCFASSACPKPIPEIHRAVMVDPKLIPLAVSRAWRSDPDIHVLLDQILPDTPDPDWGAIAFLSDAQEPAAGPHCLEPPDREETDDGMENRISVPRHAGGAGAIR